MTTKLIAGNWKLNGSLAKNAALIDELRRAEMHCVVCVPYPYLAQVQALVAGSLIELGAQDVSEYEQGAYTGEVSAAMLVEFGCRYVIVGHSERRALFGDSDQVVGRKAASALAAGLTPIVCVGETLAERELGEVEAVIRRQLQAVADCVGGEALPTLVVAYEPVWAIGTGRSATPEQVAQTHGFIRAWFSARCDASAVRILYGGSVKPENAAVLFSTDDVDGGLIGGASLVGSDFVAICRAA